MDDIRKHEPLWGVWKVDSFIGKGSYGKVYKIYHEKAGKMVYAAAKLISVPKEQSEIRETRRNRLATDDASMRMFFEERANKFLQEIDMMAMLEGESNIVNYESHVKIEKKDGIGWDIIIRMEFLTVLGLYSEDHAITKKDVIRLGIDICNAIKSCQSKNIMHRDIKIENIFISEDGRFKLGDLGIAREVDGTTTGTKIGTENYMAPEVFNGKYNNSADIYSLGIVMYRLLNDMRMPFYNDDYEVAYKKRIIDGEKFPKPRFGDGRLLEIILKACAFNKNDRYSNPDDMISDLLKVQKSVSDVIVLEPLHVTNDRGTLGDLYSKSTETIYEKTDIISENTMSDSSIFVDRTLEGTMSDVDDIYDGSQNNKKIIFMTFVAVILMGVSAFYFFKTRPVLATEICGLPYRVHLAENGTYQLNIELLPEKSISEIVLTSSNDDIAVIDENGLISTKNSGDVIITASAGSVSRSMILSVSEERIFVTDVVGVPGEAELLVGHSMTINGKAVPENATDTIVTYISSNPEVASVDMNGTVNAVSAGQTIIFVSAGEITREMIVLVKEEEVVEVQPKVTVSPPKVVIPEKPAVVEPPQEPQQQQPSKPYTDPGDANGFI